MRERTWGVGSSDPWNRDRYCGLSDSIGAMVAFAARHPLWVAAILVGLFAIFHGHAHLAELLNQPTRSRSRSGSS